MTNDNSSVTETGELVFRELLHLSPGQFQIYSRLAAEAALGRGVIARGIDHTIHVATDEDVPPVPLRTFPLADEGGRVVIMRPREEDLA